jgi:hypothetical protein
LLSPCLGLGHDRNLASAARNLKRTCPQ